MEIQRPLPLTLKITFPRTGETGQMKLNSLANDYDYQGEVPNDERRVDILATKLIMHHKHVRSN